jgi:2-methylisocitrate lyase-like PEP mutase family enzyme
MSQADKARRFKALHIPGNPLVLYNIWDAGSAKSVAGAGAQALATGSWSVAAAQGYADGEAIPLDFALQIIARITASTDLPVSVDFEGGYATAPAALAANLTRVIAAGGIGINFEDQIVGGTGLHPIADQVQRIKAIRAAADAAGVPLFINARTDLFLKTQTNQAALVAEALARQTAYAQAGADGFFIPGLGDAALIAQICQASTLPVNVMMVGSLTALPTAARLGAARASFGPGPYRVAQDDLKARAEKLF